MKILLASSVLGALLSRSKIYILIPTICVALCGLVIAGLSRGDDPWSLAISAGLAIIGVQVGYICGIGLHFLWRRHIRANLRWPTTFKRETGGVFDFSKVVESLPSEGRGRK